MDIQDTHLATVDDIHDRVGFDSIEILLVLPKLNELMRNDVFTHGIF